MYSIIRTKYHKKQKLTSVDNHNRRITPQKNVREGGEFYRAFGDPKHSLLDLINERIKHFGIEVPTGKMAVRTNFAMEFVLTASPEFFDNCSDEELEQWKKDQIIFAKEKFKGRLVAIDYHNDELSPHFHVTTIPAVKVKKKNRQGKKQKARGEKPTYTTVKKLSQSTLYTPATLEKLCTEYAEHNAKYGLKRGEFRRQNREHVDHTSLKNHRNLVSKDLPVQRKKLEDLISEHIKLESKNRHLEIANKEVSELLFMNNSDAIKKIADYAEPVLKMMKKFTDDAMSNAETLNFDEVESAYSKSPKIAQNVLEESYSDVVKLNNRLRR